MAEPNFSVVTDKLNGVLNMANDATGEQDTTIYNAVKRLIDLMGSGEQTGLQITNLLENRVFPPAGFIMSNGNVSYNTASSTATDFIPCGNETYMFIYIGSTPQSYASYATYSGDTSFITRVAYDGDVPQIVFNGQTVAHYQIFTPTASAKYMRVCWKSTGVPRSKGFMLFKLNDLLQLIPR